MSMGLGGEKKPRFSTCARGFTLGPKSFAGADTALRAVEVISINHCVTICYARNDNYKHAVAVEIMYNVSAASTTKRFHIERSW